ncbi:hypothetical protein FPOAC2_12377 [Fusarium poae]
MTGNWGFGNRHVQERNSAVAANAYSPKNSRASWGHVTPKWKMDQLQCSSKNELPNCVMIPVYARTGLKKRCFVVLGAQSRPSWVSLGSKTKRNIPYYTTSHRHSKHSLLSHLLGSLAVLQDPSVCLSF